MNNNESIAVIILTYNRFDLLKKAIHSVLTQKNISYHIYVFDNHSMKSLYPLVKNNPYITYILHKNNLGFARNFYYAMEYVLKRNHKYSFLLGDDDMVAYPTAIFDLLQLLKQNKDVHVVRGGFIKYQKSVYFPTQSYIFSEDKHKKKKRDQIRYSIQHSITFYSGLLFRNALFKIPKPKTYDLVSPFLTPLFSILKYKKYEYLPSKITVIALVDHNQLATQIYNDQVSNTAGISRALIACGRKPINPIYLHEFINYKIYSDNTELIKKYYNEYSRASRGLKKSIIHVIYSTPRQMLIILKMFVMFYIRCRTYVEIILNHRYLFQNNPCLFNYEK